MDILAEAKKHKYLILSLGFILLNAAAIFILFGARKYSDTSGYLEVIRWLQGGDWQTTPYYRLLKPLGPIMAIPFEFLGGGAGLIVQNIFFYIFSSFLIFKITELIYNDKKTALLASIFFASATPVMEVGLSYLTDMGGWFFYLLSIFLTLAYFKNHAYRQAGRNEKLVAMNGLLSGTGFLMKETGGLGSLFFGFMVLFSQEFDAKNKIKKLIYFGAFFLVPVLAVQILVFKYFHFTYWDWYLAGGRVSAGEGGITLLALRYLGQFFRILGILWPFVLLGIWREWRERNWERIKIFLCLVPASFSFLLWTVSGGGRVVFIFAPLGIILAAYGCQKLKPAYLIAFTALLLIVNYIFVWLNPGIPFTDLIYRLFIQI